MQSSTYLIKPHQSRGIQTFKGREHRTTKHKKLAFPNHTITQIEFYFQYSVI